MAIELYVTVGSVPGTLDCCAKYVDTVRSQDSLKGVNPIRLFWKIAGHFCRQGQD